MTPITILKTISYLDNNNNDHCNYHILWIITLTCSSISKYRACKHLHNTAGTLGIATVVNNKFEYNA